MNSEKVIQDLRMKCTNRKWFDNIFEVFVPNYRNLKISVTSDYNYTDIKYSDFSDPDILVYVDKILQIIVFNKNHTECYVIHGNNTIRIQRNYKFVCDEIIRYSNKFVDYKSNRCKLMFFPFEYNAEMFFYSFIEIDKNLFISETINGDLVKEKFPINKKQLLYQITNKE